MAPWLSAAQHGAERVAGFDRVISWPTVKQSNRNACVSGQSLNIQVEDVRIRAILSSYRKRVPVTEGYVEVKDGGKWKQICDADWTQLNSRVICGMFGFPGERKYNARVYK